MSLGAINFCLKAIIDGDHIKLANFNAPEHKLAMSIFRLPETFPIAHSLPPVAKRKLAEFEAIKVKLRQLRGNLAGVPSDLKEV